MNTDIELVDEPTEFFAPVSTDAISTLLSQYNSIKDKIDYLGETIKADNAIAFDYYIKGCKSQYAGYLNSTLFNTESAIAALNSDFWSRTLALTDVLDLMPQKRRDEWYKLIQNNETPDFTEDTVRNTLTDLLNQRTIFFSEKVDGVFRALSGTHVTNAPEGFGKRMIIAYMLYDYGGVNYSRCGIINDLRAVIAKFMGRKEPKHFMTDAMINSLKSQWGEWVSVDGGTIRVRLYKKGTVHVEIHPDMVWKLNAMLANLYPMAIPSQFRTKPKTKVRTFSMIQRPLPMEVLEAIHSLSEYKIWNETRRCFVPVDNTLKYTTQVEPNVKSEVDQILVSIGAVKMQDGNKHYFQFEYNPQEVVNEIITNGAVPDRKSHQYYPTPENLAQIAVSLAGIEDNHTVLEPSAGTGGIAAFLPKKNLQCVEISKLHAVILESKGYVVECKDFLQHVGYYDRIVMNPPFSENRWKAHLEHAIGMLNSKGKLVAILPYGAKTSKINLQGCSIVWSDEYSNEFAGTSVSVVIAVVERG